MGVRVTAALIAAIVQIMARVGLSPGINAATALPTQAPVKNRGIINPPRHPPVTVMLMAAILAKASANKKRAGKL